MTERESMRTALRSRRERLSAAQRIAAASAVAAVLEQLPEFIIDTRVAGYWAVGGELPLNVALAAMRARGQAWHLPVVSRGRTLRFAPWRPGEDIEPNRYGIPEPKGNPAILLAADALDLVLVPLLGFDRRGHRLGSGGGYYDRSFAFLRNLERPAQPVLVGIGYGFQELPQLPDQDWDVRMDFVATERELIDCTPAAQ